MILMRGLQKLIVQGAILLGTLMLTGCGTYQQIRGRFAPLAGTTQLNIVYDYQGMTVGKFASEGDFIRKSVADREAEEPGSGKTWLATWKADREIVHQPKFEELLNESLLGAGVWASKGLDNAPYTLLVKFLHLETGWNVALVRQHAQITLSIKITKTGNPNRVIVELLGNKILGADSMGLNFSVSSRLSNAYGKAGKDLGELLSAKL